MVPFIAALVNVVVLAFYGLAVLAAFSAWHDPQGRSTRSFSEGGWLVTAVSIMTFATYWHTEVVKNVAHTTVAGIYGSIYYGKNSAAGIPRNPARGAFCRAVTCSFGSICFGSLLTSIVTCLCELANSAAASQRRSSSIFSLILCAVLRALAAMLNWLVRMFSKYAFVQVALFGKSFIRAAKE